LDKSILQIQNAFPLSRWVGKKSMNLQIYPVTIETVESAVAREKLLSAYSQEHVLVAADQIEAPEISDYINGLETLCWLITDEQTVQSLRLKFDPDRYPELALLGDGVWDVSSWIQPLCPPGGVPQCDLFRQPEVS